MTIKPGDKLPQATFTVMTAEGPSAMTTADIFAGRKVVLFALPGAFTPTCHKQHVPGFIAKAAELKAKGVDTIACLSVNDVFVMDAWDKATGGNGAIMFLADGNGEFTTAAGLDMDASSFGMGLRSQRYALIADDGTVTHLNMETAKGEIVESGPDKILQQL